MAWTPINEDVGPASGRRFGVRVGPFVTADVLAVRGLRAKNTEVVAVVSVIRDEHREDAPWTASIAWAWRDELPVPGNDEGEDGA